LGDLTFTGLRRTIEAAVKRIDWWQIHLLWVSLIESRPEDVVLLRI
jgi:hypothetical protein